MTRSIREASLFFLSYFPPPFFFLVYFSRRFSFVFFLKSLFLEDKHVNCFHVLASAGNPCLLMYDYVDIDYAGFFVTGVTR